MNRAELIRDLCGAALRDGCFFALKSVDEVLDEYGIKNAKTTTGMVASQIAIQLRYPAVKRVYEERAEEYGNKILEQIKRAGEEDAETESV